MGEIVGSLGRISENYDLWMVVIGGRISKQADVLMRERFEEIVEAVGKHVVVSKMKGEGIIEAESKFDIQPHAARPVLVITDKHPNRWTPRDHVIRIELGGFSDSNRLAMFLENLCSDLKSGDFGTASWTARWERITQIGAKYGGSAISVAGMALGFA